MALYKAKGVNPASGCVPMLLTMPFLFAFYAMLSQAIEIRGADFVGWIRDLSRPDPVLHHAAADGCDDVLAAEDHADLGGSDQQKMMMIMPLMFTFMFLSYPSGLVIYWSSVICGPSDSSTSPTTWWRPAKASAATSPRNARTSGREDDLRRLWPHRDLRLRAERRRQDGPRTQATAEEMPDGLRINLTARMARAAPAPGRGAHRPAAHRLRRLPSRNHREAPPGRRLHGLPQR